MDLGTKIRELRKEAGLSLRKLAAQAGLSYSMLSLIENHKTNPSFTTLRKLASSLDIPLFQLVTEGNGASPNLVHREDRRLYTFDGSGLEYEVIHSDMDKKMGVMIGRLKPHSASSPELLSHAGEECILIMEGGMLVEMAEETIELGPADSLYFDSSAPHRLVNHHGLPCRYFIAITPPKI